MQIVFKYFFIKRFIPESLAGPKKRIGIRAECSLEIFHFSHVFCKVGRRGWAKLTAAVKNNSFILACKWEHCIFPFPESRSLWHFSIPGGCVHEVFCVFNFLFSDFFSQLKTCMGITRKGNSRCDS